MTPEPRILHVLEALGGGTSQHLIDLVSTADGVIHEVAVPRRRVGWLSDDEAVTKLGIAGAIVHLVEMRRLPVHPRNIASLVTLRRLIRVRRPDVVHCHSSIGGALGRAAAIGWGAVRIYTPNGLSTSAPAVLAERALGSLTDCMIAVSESEKELAVALRIMDESRVVVIPNGIDAAIPTPPTADVRAFCGIDQSTPLIACVARLVHQKGADVFVRAAALAVHKHPTAHFLLIGDGVDRDLIARELAVANSTRIHHLPNLGNAASVMPQIDALVSASRFEGAPYVPREAMRAGVPVVLSDAVGNRDTVVDGVSGLLVPVEDPHATAAAMIRLLSDKPLGRALGAAGHARFMARFRRSEMGTAHVALYHQLLRGRRV